VAVPSTVNVPADYPTIQNAIDAAADADTVLVAPGTYHERLVIDGKAITLASWFYTNCRQERVEETIVDGGGGGAVIRVNASANGSRIIGLTVQNGNDGILAYATIHVLNSRIINNADGIDYEGGGGVCCNNLLAHNTDDGVDLDGACDVAIMWNTIRDNDDDGIEIRLHDYTGPTLNVNICENLLLRNGEDGVQLIDYPGLSDRVFRIERNIFVDTAMAALGCMADGNSNENLSGAPLPERVHLTGNTFVGNHYGVTGGANLIALNNMFVDTVNTALRNLTGDSIAAYNLFWQNTVDYENSVVDLPCTMHADPLLDPDYRPTSSSAAIDAAVAAFTWHGELVHEAPEWSYWGMDPDLGAREYEPLCRVGGALSLDAGDYAVVPRRDGLYPEHITMAAWIRPDVGAANEYIMSAKQSGGYSMAINVNGGGIGSVISGRCRIDTGSEQRYVNVYGQTPIVAGRWAHVALTYDGMTFRTYLDGALDGVLAAPGSLVRSGYSKLFLGCESGGRYPAGGWFSGLIDEAAIFSRALSSTEVEELVSNQITENHPAWWDLVGYWRFDDIGSQGGTPDDGPNGLTATAHGSASVSPGAPSTRNALKFQEGDFVKAPYYPGLYPEKITLGAWINPHALGKNDYILSTKQRGGYSLAINVNGGGAGNVISGRCKIDTGSGQTYVNVYGGTPIVPDTWSHVALTYDGTAFRVYVDGVQDGAMAAPGSLVASPYSRLFVGCESGGRVPAAGWFPGTIDEVAVFDDALTLSEISDLMSGEIGASHSRWGDLISYWHFDEVNEHYQTPDAGPGGHTGILTGGECVAPDALYWAQRAYGAPEGLGALNAAPQVVRRTSGIRRTRWAFPLSGRDRRISELDDLDHDGMPTWVERIAGTDPADPTSVFAVTRVESLPDQQLQITWPSTRGKYYAIYRSRDLEKKPGLLRTGISSTPPENTITDTVQDGGPHFYTVSILPESD